MHFLNVLLYSDSEQCSDTFSGASSSCSLVTVEMAKMAPHAPGTLVSILNGCETEMGPWAAMGSAAAAACLNEQNVVSAIIILPHSHLSPLIGDPLPPKAPFPPLSGLVLLHHRSKGAGWESPEQTRQDQMPKTLDWYADWKAFVCDCVCVCIQANKQEQAVGPRSC